ncbi:hypothetical protein [Sphingomonas sp. BK345]|uniref:hypothetical protein n=1 Tax=Sphingomonas sp. BK345 TaxID=2586980 RepID=UPI001609DEC7|nr:hypothetical protein [Sphingomonas sp. BK345]MBB3471926.1 hypothetical protein [Sphingomonas sp. BK345]
MPIRYTRARVHFEQRCTVEVALELVAFLARTPRASVSLVHCTGMHSALVQVLLAFRPPLHGTPSPALAPLLPFLTAAPAPASTDH